MAEQQGQAERLGREAVRVQWALLGQWWCVPADMTPDEQTKMLGDLKDDMLFIGCPDEYIADRLYGGFPCSRQEDRRHVYFAAGEYSFLAAREGRYWANDSANRQRTWETLLTNNNDPAPPLNGPFTADAPRDGTTAEKTETRESDA